MIRYYDNPKDDAAFSRCIEVMVRLLKKYGPRLLEQQKETKLDKAA